MILAAADINVLWVVSTLVIFVGTAVAVFVGGRPLMAVMKRQQQQYDTVLRRQLLMNVSPRAAMVMTIFVVVAMAGMGYAVNQGLVGVLAGGTVGILTPPFVLRSLRQLVSGIQTLASGVRAGLNLVQSMGIVARDGPVPLRQEFAHLLQEYEFGLGLEDAMNNAVDRIGSSDFRLLFSALQTHRERGGDLGETLDRIAESIREIQRLEKRVIALTAQGRATARALGVMPLVVLAILYFMVSPEGVRELFYTDLGKVLLMCMVALNLIGFLWIKKIVTLDI
jgi:tight adherence protein B